MTDFGADDAFGSGAAKLKEHYGIEMPVSTVQRTTEHHAHCIYEQDMARVIEPGTAAGFFIGEMDGSKVPVVEPSPAAEDHRKGKVLSWKEVRLNLVHPKGSVTPMFGGNFVGGLKKAGGNGHGVRRKPGSVLKVSCMPSATVRRGLRTKWTSNSVPRGVI